MAISLATRTRGSIAAAVASSALRTCCRGRGRVGMSVSCAHRNRDASETVLVDRRADRETQQIRQKNARSCYPKRRGLRRGGTQDWTFRFDMRFPNATRVTLTTVTYIH